LCSGDVTFGDCNIDQAMVHFALYMHSSDSGMVDDFVSFRGIGVVLRSGISFLMHGIICALVCGGRGGGRVDFWKGLSTVEIL
jgi:hypothetical protein